MEIENLQKEKLGSSALIQMVKSAICLCPGLPLLVDQFSNYQHNIQYNNIVDVLQKHESQIKYLTDIVLDKMYMSSPYYAKDILTTIQKAKDELNEEKRLVYASYLTACCHKDNISDKNKDIYLEYIGRIDFVDFFILKTLTKLYNGKNAVEHCTSVYNLHHDDKVSQNDIRIHIDHLSSLGLIERCDKEEVDRFNKRVGNVNNREKIFKRLNLFQRSYLGEGLYQFVIKSKYDVSSQEKPDSSL